MTVQTLPKLPTLERNKQALPGRLPMSKSHIPALNLTNGILSLVDSEGHRKPQLIPHDKDYGFKFCSSVSYDPNADTTQAEKLLECISNLEQREMFLRGLAVSLDVAGYMAEIDRPRAIILIGEGSNGKDALKNCFNLILGDFGKVTLDDFNDQAKSNKKFNLANIGKYSVNWSSENTSKTNIGNLKTLIDAISGGTFSADRKYQDAQDIEARSLFIFHANKEFHIGDALKFVKSRLAFIDMNRTYSVTPDLEAGELQANPRFYLDKDFQVNEVCSGLLRLLIEAYEKLWTKNENDEFGNVPWSISDYKFDEIVKKDNHFHRFYDDMGVVNDPDSYIMTGDLNMLYKAWLVNNELALGYIDTCNGDSFDYSQVIDVPKDRFKLNQDAINPCDKPKPASAQFSGKFGETFPKHKPEKDTTNISGRKNASIIRGLKLPFEMAKLEPNF